MVKTMRRNTDAPVSGGATGMSVEAPVMGAEQSGASSGRSDRPTWKRGRVYDIDQAV